MLGSRRNVVRELVLTGGVIEILLDLILNAYILDTDRAALTRLSVRMRVVKVGFTLSCMRRRFQESAWACGEVRAGCRAIRICFTTPHLGLQRAAYDPGIMRFVGALPFFSSICTWQGLTRLLCICISEGGNDRRAWAFFWATRPARTNWSYCLRYMVIVACTFSSYKLADVLPVSEAEEGVQDQQCKTAALVCRCWSIVHHCDFFACETIAVQKIRCCLQVLSGNTGILSISYITKSNTHCAFPTNQVGMWNVRTLMKRFEFLDWTC